jgi:ATP-binding cassette, subfamily C, bacterial
MKYHWVKQQSGEDCAAASLAIVTKHYGRNLSINRIRELVGTGEGGTTMLGLKRGAQELGFKTKTIQAAPEILDELDEFTLPAIIYWKGYHFVVLYGKKSNKYVVSDPALGIRYLSRQEISKGWEGWIMLLLEPDPELFFAQPEDKNAASPFDSFVQRIWLYRGILAKLLPINFVVGLLALATPLLLQFFTDQILVKYDTQKLTLVAISVVLLTLFSSGLSWFQSNLVAYFAERLQTGLKIDFAQQILHLPLSYHEARRSGTAIRRLSDIQRINLLVSQLIIELPIKGFVGIVALACIYIYSWKLGLIIIAIAAIMTLSTIAFQPAIRQATYNSFSVAGENSGVLSEAFTGALTLKTTAAAPQLWQEIKERLEHEANSNFRTAKTRIVNNLFSDTMSALGTVALLWYGSNLIFQKELTIGQLIAVYGLKESFLQLISTLVRFVVDFTQVKAITQLLAELFGYTPENLGDEQKLFTKISQKADISCQDLNFQYPGRVRLLENLSVTIPGGMVVALIGRSGCGKSTLAKLLAGLYPLQSGNISIGEINLQNLPLDCLRQQIALVPQEAFFFRRSIIDNFRLSAPHASFDEIVTACKVTGADEFISQFPRKYDTILGAVAANVSGGQKQRLAIARAIINNPPILILDESTANLDPLTEAEVLDRLLAYRQGKTTILISHRPKVINRANWIVLLEEGKLQFTGSKEEFRSLEGKNLEFINP